MTKIELSKEGGYKIELQTRENNFIVSEKVEDTDDSFNELKIFKTFENAQSYIENREKRKVAGIIKKKKPLMAIYKYGVGYEEIKINSIGTSRYGFDIWITFLKDNIRSQKSFYEKEFLKMTDDNKKKIVEMINLRKEADKIEKSLDSYTEEEIKKYFKEEEI